MKILLMVLALSAPAFAGDVPPHARLVAGGYGLIECESGYVMQSRICVAESTLRERAVEVSDLPSAGEGAPGTCPSGGCRTYVAPSYSSPRVIETWTRYGDQGSIGRLPSGPVSHSVTTIR